MRTFTTYFSALIPALALLFFLSGCDTKTPKTVALPPTVEKDALAAFDDFSQSTFPSDAECTYEISWEILTGKGNVTAIVQLDEPDLLKFTAFDPLGRTLYLAVSDGKQFTLVDNRAASAKQGGINGKSWREFVPSPLQVENLLPLLGGRLEDVNKAKVLAASSTDNTGYWYTWKDANDLSHQVLFNKEHKWIEQHLLLNKEKKILLEISYLSYMQDKETGYLWPKRIQMTGDMIKGGGTLNFTCVGQLSFDPLPASTFYLQLPPHFKVENLP